MINTDKFKLNTICIFFCGFFCGFKNKLIKIATAVINMSKY